MRNFKMLMACLLVSAPLIADEAISVPWNEFKGLYRDSIERELLKQTAPQEKKPQVFSIDEARYVLNVRGEVAQGEAVLSGTVVSGEPEPIPLFSAEVVITDIKGVTGGTVLSGSSDGRALFLPNGPDQGFQVTVCFLVRPEEDGGARGLSLGIPRALKNALVLSLPSESQVVEAPGIADAEGAYRFAACDCITVKYLDRRGLTGAAAIEVDMVSRVRVQENRILVTTSLLPIRSVPGPLILLAPEGAECLSSSLKASKVEGNRFEFVLPPGERGPFSIEFALHAPTAAGEASFPLPAIEGNTGQHGRFVVEEPDDGQATVTAKGLATQIPVERLGPELSRQVGNARFYMTIPEDERVNVKFARFQSVSTPVTVLECLHFFSSFEESGNVLSVLMMDVPPDVGPRMKLKAVPESEIWSLSVNDAKKSVYAAEEGAWVVPLADGQVSHVELAFLRKGPKLGLQGRLEAAIPETGLPCREVRVGVGLPGRVELLSVEGPVAAAVGEGWERPAEFCGAPYFFSRSFSKGEGMTLAISYKEPVNRPQQEKGAAP